jgi:hypothetical protein
LCDTYTHKATHETILMRKKASIGYISYIQTTVLSN